MQRDDSSYRVLFVTCGDWDLRTALPKQCHFSGVRVPGYLRIWCNVKAIYCNTPGGKRASSSWTSKGVIIPASTMRRILRVLRHGFISMAHAFTSRRAQVCHRKCTKSHVFIPSHCPFGAETLRDRCICSRPVAARTLKLSLQDAAPTSWLSWEIAGLHEDGNR